VALFRAVRRPGVRADKGKVKVEVPSATMKLAVLSDIHGNLPALEATIEHAERLSVDGFIVIGDIVIGAPDSPACWKRIKALKCPVLRGNHEGYIVSHDNPLWQTPQFAPITWAASQLGEEVRRELGALPFSLTLPNAPDLLFVHASLRNDRDGVDMYTTEAELAEMFTDLSARYVVRGHNHIAAIREWKTHQLITDSSVGLPLNGVTKAQYLILEKHPDRWQPTFYAVPYDVDEALGRFYETGYLDEAGAVAYLFYREVATATHQLTPFLRGYQRYSQRETLGLTEAVRAFLQFGSL